MTGLPEKVYSRSSPSLTDLFSLIEDCQTHHVSEESRKFLTRLATYEPDLRLAINLKTFLGLMVYHEVQNILNEGLSTDERKLLVELDLKGLSIHSKETAHGLLNVHERWVLLKRLSETFRKAKESKADHFQENLW